MANDQELQNYCTQENGVQIASVSSQIPTCPASNLLSTDRKTLWMSQNGLPQSITLDLRNIQDYPEQLKCFGFDCWHDYQSNPSVMEFLVSSDGKEFITWRTIYPELREGVQLFSIDPLTRKYSFIKIVIRETYGAAKTYMNQIFLFEDAANVTTESLNDSQQHTEKSQTNYNQMYEYSKPSQQFQQSGSENEKQLKKNIQNKLQFQEHTLPPQPQNQQKQQQQHDDLQAKMQQMHREVDLLKHSAQQQINSSDQRNYLGLDEIAKVQQGFPTLTSTEKEVRFLKEEVSLWKQKFEQLRLVVERLEQQLKHQQPLNSMPQSPKPPKIVTPQTTPEAIDHLVDRRILEMETKFQVQFQLQEQVCLLRFKEQQIDLVSKIRNSLKQEDPKEKNHRGRSNSRGSKKKQSARRKESSLSSNSDKENGKTFNRKRDKSNGSKQMKKQRVAELLQQLQQKLSIRAKKVEELTLSSNKKTKKKFSVQERERVSSSSDNNYSNSSDEF